MPRPISSRITKARSSAWFKIAAVSTISTMNVERPRARSSEAPTRLKSCETAPICARAAGTNEPICAISAISAFWRRNVDLPAMFGPVSNQTAALLSDLVSVQSLATNAAFCALSDLSTTGWRPRSISNAPEVSTVGRVQPSPLAMSASAVNTSSSASAADVVATVAEVSKMAVVRLK